MPPDLQQCGSVDCRPPQAPAARAAIPVQPQSIDYQAKDYDSFLRALLDLIPSRIPGWRERTEADLGMALLELFAFAGDQLSYYQDRVANEAYLGSAALFESVRKHLALIGYTMDPGAAASVYIAAEVSQARYVADGFAVSTMAAKDHEPAVFETAGGRVLHVELNSIPLGADAPSNLARTEAVLDGELDTLLPPGSTLRFEGANGAEWVQTEGFATTNPVLHTTTIRLRRPLRNDYAAATARVLGNILLATHGLSRSEQGAGTGQPGQSFPLTFAPLTFLDSPAGSKTTLRVLVDGVEWERRDDFIDSRPTDQHYTTTQDNDGFVTVHFGDLRQGRAPDAGAPVAVFYRTGIGEAGLVPAGALTEFTDPDQRILRLWNPEPSFGMRQPESLEQARLVGPRSLRKPNRAVTARDYEAAALEGVWIGDERVKPIQAKAAFRFTGSWQTAFVSLDFEDRKLLRDTPERETAFEQMLTRLSVAGLDVQVESARYAPLHIALTVHVKPQFFARVVRESISRALKAFFAPGRFAFGQAVRLSDLYAAVQAIAGVEYVTVRRFKRLGDRHPDRAATGSIELAPLEIARCDNDPANPANGIVVVRTCGGREG